MQHSIDLILGRVSTANLIAVALLWASVIASVVVSYCYSGLPRTWRGFWQHTLPPGTLSHPSARADFLFWISRRFVNLILIAPTALSAVGIGTAVNAGLSAILPYHAAPAGQPIGTGMLLLFTIMMFMAYDLSYYLYHNAQHRVPVLWEIHKVHHSAEVMVGTTKDRVHPVDDFMNRIWEGFVAGPVYGVWLFFAYDPIEITVFGLNVYFLRAILMMDFTRHTHYKITFGKYLNHVFICPHYHQLHHSLAPEHWDKNFGLLFAFWDRMFGTLAVPKKNEDFVFGLTNDEHVDYRSWLRLYYVPFVKIYNLAAAWATPRKIESRDHA